MEYKGEVQQIEKNKLQYQIDFQQNLLKFFNSFVEKITGDVNIQKLIEGEIEKKLEEGDVNILSLIRLYEVTRKTENEAALGILSILRENQKLPKEPERGIEGSDLTKEDIKDVRGVLDILKKVKKIKDVETLQKKKEFI